MLQEISRPWYDTLWEVLAVGVEAGDFRPLDPEREALRACALMDGLAMTVLLGVRGYGRDWAIGEAFDYLDGATTKKGRKAHA